MAPSWGPLVASAWAGREQPLVSGAGGSFSPQAFQSRRASSVPSARLPHPSQCLSSAGSRGPAAGPPWELYSRQVVQATSSRVGSRGQESRQDSGQVLLRRRGLAEAEEAHTAEWLLGDPTATED